jgi:N-acetylglucosaminyldiphosphoundecaprenol N-acetyl-beta-D-mannosaminyltransferase
MNIAQQSLTGDRPTRELAKETAVDVGAERRYLRPDTATILGVRVHRITRGTAIALLDEMVRSRRPHHVVTVNPEFVMIARKHREFRNVLLDADLAIPDGAGIVLASRLLGRPIYQRVTGVDVVDQFAGFARFRGYRFFFLGAAEGVAELAAEKLRRRYPGLIVAGTFSGSPSPEEEEEICRRIEASRPDVLLVAYGAPAQDLWIARTRSRLNVPVSIGVGGTLDYISGVVVRAPRWIRGAGFEWAYRLARQPTRWKRMLRLPWFALLVIRQAIGRFRAFRRAPPAESGGKGNT